MRRAEVAAALLVLAALPPSLAGQNELTGVVVTSGDSLRLWFSGSEIPGCLWASTYWLHGAPMESTHFEIDVTLSFYEGFDYVLVHPGQRDGSQARLHTRVSIGSSGPVLHHRKQIGLGEFEHTAGLSDAGELVLAILGVPTRLVDGRASVRNFSQEEIERIFDRWPGISECHEAAQRVAAGL